MQQQQTNKPSGFLSKYTYVLIGVALLIGIGIGYVGLNFQKKNNPTGKTSTVKVVQLLIHNSEETRTWNNITLNEGESVGMLLRRVSEADGIELSFQGEGKEATISSLMNKSTEGGTWTYYIDNASPLPVISSFFLKDGNVISLIYTPKKL